MPFRMACGIYRHAGQFDFDRFLAGLLSIRADSRTDRRPQGSAENCTVTATDLITDRRTGSTTDTATDSGIQGRIIRIRLKRDQR